VNFLDNISKNISKRVTEVAQVAAKKSSEVVEITKLNMSINAEEDKIQKLYEEIGKIIYDCFKSQEDVPEEIKEFCAEIQESENNIKKYKKRILELKSLKLCPNCGAELEGDENFCPQCGARQKKSNAKDSNTKDSDSKDLNSKDSNEKNSNGKNEKSSMEDKKADKYRKIEYDFPDDEDETSGLSIDMTKSSKYTNEEEEDNSSSDDDQDLSTYN